MAFRSLIGVAAVFEHIPQELLAKRVVVGVQPRPGAYEGNGQAPGRRRLRKQNVVQRGPAVRKRRVGIRPQLKQFPGGFPRAVQDRRLKGADAGSFQGLVGIASRCHKIGQYPVPPIGTNGLNEVCLRPRRRDRAGNGGGSRSHAETAEKVAPPV